MKTIVFCFVVVFMCGSILASVRAPAEAAPAPAEPCIQFLYGVVLLTSRPQPDTILRRQRFLELSRITGVSLSRFNAWVLSYKNRPEQWKEIHETIVQLIDKEEKLWQTSMSANLPTRTLKPKR